MSEYVIVTDSSADLTAGMAEELGVEVLPLSFMVKGQTYRNYPDNREMDPGAFYAMLRAGEMATTAAVNVADYTSVLEPLLEQGKDVLVLAFSSGLSATYQSSVIAVEELRARFPERKIFTVDTLCASLGQGLLVYLAAKKQQAGASIEEVRDWAEENKLHLCHWFTVDDLHFLKRGGQVVFISHGDCLADAEKVAGDVKKRFGVKEVVINYVGPVIGAHSGPGTLALFFLGSRR